MVRPLHAHVLLDTGPNRDELVHIAKLFDGVGMTAEVEGHSYGGPPPTSMFLIVVNVPLLAFLDNFATDRETGSVSLESLLCELLAIRADSGRWGRPHTLKLENAHSDLSVVCRSELPSKAYTELLKIDLSAFDRGSARVTICWQPDHSRWVARLDAGPRIIQRRLAIRRNAAPGEYAVRQLSTAELGELWRIAESGTASVITWQRAQAVLLSGIGWSISSIEAKTLLSRPRIQAIVSDFNRDGFSALAPEYEDGTPWHPGDEVEREARAIAAARPEELGLEYPDWEVSLLGEFLVSSGIVEDVTPRWLATLLKNVRVPAGR